MRAKRRRYGGMVWARLFGGKRVGEPGGIVILAGGLGEARVAFEVAREFGGEVSILTKTRLEGSGAGQAETGAIPFNNPFSVWLFFRRYRPSAILVVEFCDFTHLKYWAMARGVPLIVFNVPITERETERVLAKHDDRWRWRLAGAYLARDDATAERLRRIGVPSDQVEQFGPIGMYVDAPPGAESIRDCWRAELGLDAGDGPLVVAASTWDEDEDAVLDAWMRFRSEHPDSILILAPRELMRLEQVRERVSTLKLDYVLRSAKKPLEGARVLLLDKYGELREVYGIADVAYVGGTMDHFRGGHTPVEALAWRVPITLGPSYAQQANVVQPLIDSGVAVVCPDAQSLDEAWTQMTTDRELRARIEVECARLLSASEGGATRLYEALNGVIGK